MSQASAGGAPTGNTANPADKGRCPQLIARLAQVMDDDPYRDSKRLAVQLARWKNASSQALDEEIAQDLKNQASVPTLLLRFRESQLAGFGRDQLIAAAEDALTLQKERDARAADGDRDEIKELRSEISDLQCDQFGSAPNH